MSDFHIDPRYLTGSEADCTGYLCCRGDKFNISTPNQINMPAPRFGAFKCDTPFDLAIAALSSIPTLTGTQNTGFDFTIYTGDIAAHDNDQGLSRGAVEYAENFMYTLFAKMLGAGPTFAALGNHDSWPQALQVLNTLPTYDLISSFFTCSRSSTNVTIAGILLSNSLGITITSPLSGYITNG
jgi:sphingomyelin phosphodiesterase